MDFNMDNAEKIFKILVIGICFIILWLAISVFLVSNYLSMDSVQKSFCQENNFSYNDSKYFCQGKQFVCNYDSKKCWYVS